MPGRKIRRIKRKKQSSFLLFSFVCLLSACTDGSDVVCSERGRVMECFEVPVKGDGPHKDSLLYCFNSLTYTIDNLTFKRIHFEEDFEYLHLHNCYLAENETSVYLAYGFEVERDKRDGCVSFEDPLLLFQKQKMDQETLILPCDSCGFVANTVKISEFPSLYKVNLKSKILMDTSMFSFLYEEEKGIKEVILLGR